MNTREELLNGLGEAVNIIRQLANIQQRLNNTRAKYKNTIALSAPKKVSIIKIILTYFVLSTITTIILALSGGANMSIEEMAQKSMLFGFVPYLAIPWVIFRTKKKNKKIEEQNKITQQQNNQIYAYNEQVQLEEQNVLNELQQVQNVYRQRISPWYPVDYCSVGAVEFLYNAINNYRADSLKEAINLYETTLHQQRVENNQQQALRQQTLSNLLSAGSLVMQGATLGAINNQTSAINNQTASVNNVNDTLNRIRRGY